MKNTGHETSGVQTAAQTAAEGKEQNGNGGVQTESKPGLTMIGADADPFDELLKAADEVKAKVRDAYDAVSTFQRKLRDAQKSVKSREREYQGTKQLITKLRAASGF